jgi:cytidine deaminase
MAIVKFSPNDKISSAILEMAKAAYNASKLAYAPYSNYQVGAVVKDANGQLFPGGNQENASYPLCMCAERVALYNMSASFENGTINELAVFANSSDKNPSTPPSPCGACRQVIAEYQMRQEIPIKVILTNQYGYIWVFDSINDLLPWGFDPSNL